MALHTYNPTEWKNAPDHKTTPVNANNLNNIEDGIKNAYIDISNINTEVGKKIAKSDLTSISESGSTASQAIGAGTYFYLDGVLVRAILDIASGATFTENTNYVIDSDGALNKPVIYSTEEHAIGTWIDGSTLYEKTINTGNLPNNSTKPINHDISNLKHTVSWDGMVYYGLDAQVSLHDQYIRVVINTSTVNISTSDNFSPYSGYITLQYTKTT